MPVNKKAAKRILGECRYDPAADRSYDVLRGGFVWDDEVPPQDSEDYFRAIIILAPAIAYRASVTLGQPVRKHESEWRQLRKAVPSWPGFRQERIFGNVERALRAAKLWEERCLARVEADLEQFDREGT